MESTSLSHLDAKRLRLLEWLTTLPAERKPATKTELASELDVSARTLRDWQAKPDFIKLWESEARRISGGPEKTQQVLEALLEQALNKESQKQVQAAKLWLEGTGAIQPKAQQVEIDLKGSRKVEELTIAELEALAAAGARDQLAERRNRAS